jgi:hypothetical protein
MKFIIDFLLLRPMFTRSGLFIVWYIYLAATILALGQYLFLFLTTRQFYSAPLILHYYIPLLVPLVIALAQLALMRLLLEVALEFIDKRSVRL